jgi:hypothetical protein
MPSFPHRYISPRALFGERVSAAPQSRTAWTATLTTTVSARPALGTDTNTKSFTATSSGKGRVGLRRGWAANYEGHDGEGITDGRLITKGMMARALRMGG